MSEIEPRRRQRHPAPKRRETDEERIARLLQDDDLFEAYYAARTILLADIGVEVTVGSEPLRLDGDIVGTDLLKAGRKERLGIGDVLGILAFQLSAYRSNQPVDFASGRIRKPGASPKDLLRSATLLAKDIPFSFFVAQTTLAIIRYNLNEDIDPRIFLANYCVYREPAPVSVRDAWTYPQLTGAVLVEVEEGGERKVFLQARRGDKTFWSTVGGHYDNMGEVAALPELREEMGLPPGVIQKAVPLCVANQAFLAGSGDERRRVKYLNVAWRLAMTSDELRKYPPRAERGYEEWQLFGKDEILKMASRGELSAIALCTLICAGYLDLADFPAVTMPSRVRYK